MIVWATHTAFASCRLSLVEIMLQPCHAAALLSPVCAGLGNHKVQRGQTSKVVTFHGRRMRLRWDRVNSTVIVVLSIFAFEYFTCVACVVSLYKRVAPAALVLLLTAF